MVLKELRARGGAQRVLAIVPPNLVRLWQFEMRTKFNEPFSVLNTATVNNLRADGYHGNPFAHPDYSSILCSSKWASNARWKDLCTEAYWDLIILDEAHHARSYPRRQHYRVVPSGQRPCSRGASPSHDAVPHRNPDATPHP